MASAHSNMASAWLEKPQTEPIPIKGSCSLGRAAGNEIVLPAEKVSRRHALIHAQENSEFWLVDLGSRNGTYLNGRRIFQPTRLNDGDLIDICHFQLIFHQISMVSLPEATLGVGTRTISDVQPMQCWLLLADIIASTHLSRSLSAEEISIAVGGWLAESKQITEDCGGGIDKYLGDGFLAFWHERGQTGPNLLRAITAFVRLQASTQPAFRLALHYGQVFTGGMAAFGQENLFGPEVNFVFRMEKIAGALGEPRLLSEAAKKSLSPGWTVSEVGRHTLPGFDGEYMFWRF
jgi:adenylate cyclase